MNECGRTIISEKLSSTESQVQGCQMLFSIVVVVTCNNSIHRARENSESKENLQWHLQYCTGYRAIIEPYRLPPSIYINSHDSFKQAELRFCAVLAMALRARALIGSYQVSEQVSKLHKQSLFSAWIGGLYDSCWHLRTVRRHIVSWIYCAHPGVSVFMMQNDILSTNVVLIIHVDIYHDVEIT